MGGLTSYVFGYGSLAADLADAIGVARLRGFRRTWGVAADNSLAVPGYKRYRDGDGSYPAVHVAFLDIVEDPGSTVNGVLAPATDDTLRALDLRERNYEPLDVTDAVDGAPPGRVFAYVGSQEGRARLAAGMAAGTAVIQRDYLDRVRAAFEALGDDQRAELEASWNLDGLPVLDLDRHDVPPAEPCE